MKHVFLAIGILSLCSCSAIPAGGEKPSITVSYGGYSVDWTSGKNPVLSMPSRNLVNPSK